VKICLTCEGVTAEDGGASCAHCGGPLLDTATVHFPERRGDEDGRAPLVGRVIDGKYRVVGVLGRGGMGVVYRAVHEVSLVHVALKVLHPRFAAREDFRAWFVGEARKAGRVVHENSARVMDVGVARDGMVYIAVEFVDGVTLDDWILGGQADPAQVVALLEQVARALAEAHAAGVVHRDLSPRNVMVTVRDGRAFAKILDFGIALGPAGAPGDPGTPDGGPGGFANPPYSAPEHLAGEAVDGRADLYSLGVLAYEALTGELPVPGDTGRELAHATVCGEIRPMRARAGVPRALVRLCHELLARDPADRPATADEVAERLHRILHPRRAALAAASILALAASAAAFAFAHAPGAVAAPFLEVRSGLLRLLPAGEVRPTLELRRADLLETRFRYGGFDPAQLVVEVDDARGRSASFAVGPVLRADGAELRFGAEAAEFVDALAERSRAGPLELRFALPSRAPLGGARLRVDDTPPRVELALVGAPSEVLDGGRRLRFAVSDEGEILRRELRAALGQGDERSVCVLDQDRVEAPAVELLAAGFPGVRGYGAVRLRAMAVDRAGNVGRSEPLEFEQVDLAVPDIESVASGRGGMVLVEDAEGARLRLRLSAEEPGLSLLAQPPGEPTLVELRGVRAIGGRLDVDLRVGSPSGRWTFAVRDPAGNLSRTFEEELTIRGSDPDLEVRPLDPDGGDAVRGVVWLGDQLVCASAPFALQLRHNPIYEVERVRVVGEDGAVVDLGSGLLRIADGRANLAVGALAAGVRELRIRLVERVEGRTVDVPGTVIRVLPEAVVLRVPEPVGEAGTSYLRDLEARAVLRRTAGAVAQGAAWRLEPPDARLLRGRIWAGPEPAWSAQELAADDAGAPLLGEAALGRGWHRIAIEAVDLLGRPLRVLRGAAPAPSVALPSGGRAAEIARFFHDDRPFQLVDSTVLVEYGQPVRVELSAALPAADLDRVRVRLAGAGYGPVRIEEERREARLSFQLPFERVAVAAGFEVLDAAGFATGVDAAITLDLVSPAGETSVRVGLRTIRSTLRAVELGGFSGRALPPAVGRIRLLPIAAPPGPWPEPRVADAAERRRARLGPPLEVRNVGDFYLQEQELDRAAYRAIVDAGLERIEAVLGEAGPAACVHPADPLGPRRLSREGMNPTGASGAGGSFTEALRAAPDRPVSGVDAFQAHAVLALLGVLVDDDPRLFRLPLGSELEIAGAGGLGRAGAPSAAAAHGRPLDGRLLRGLARRAGEVAVWPPLPDELAGLGDVVEVELGGRIFGLDSGLREWVFDLPFLSGSADSRVLLEEWLGDHPRHVEQALGLFAADGAGRIPLDLRAFAATYGVVRGSAAVPADVEGVDAPGWPGVARVLQLRRDGAGLLPGRVDPRLAGCGLRIAGGGRFVEQVRRRW
jgi:hypothetical protein